MKNYFLKNVLLFVFIPISVFSAPQFHLLDEDSITKPPKEKKMFDTALDTYNNIFKLTPLKAFDLSNAAVELVYERRTGRMLSTQLMASCLLSTNLWYKKYGFPSDIKGFSIAAEERLYFRKKAPKGAYLAVELKYLNTRYRDELYFVAPYSASDFNWGIEGNAYLDTVLIHKQTTSFSIKLGCQRVLKRFTLDVYSGLGLRYKDTRHYEKMVEEDVLMPSRHPNFKHEANRAGYYWTVHLPIGFRIGWTLW